jgi:hypothetical protein
MVCALLVIGAMLLPGFTLGTMWFHLGQLTMIEFLSLILVLVVQIFVMRHFQALSSRSMALRLVNMRIDVIRTKVLAPLDALMLRSELNEEQFEAEFFIIRRTFYSIAIYDVFESDLFGRSPVFLVGPRLKFLLDDKVLNHFHDKASEQSDHP